MSKYKTFVRRELDCGDVIHARREYRKARWKVLVLRKGKFAGEFLLLSETANLRDIRKFLRDLERNTPPSFRS